VIKKEGRATARPSFSLSVYHINNTIFMKTLTPLEKLLIELLRIDSTTGNELPLAEFIESQLAGFRVKRQQVARGRFNLIAQKGKSDVWMVAHMDTVPPFLPVKVTADKIFGRGAIDNKGNIAGAIFAARETNNINLLFTVGEDVDFAGAKKVDIKGKAIILEPTGFKKILAQCGVVSAKITATGDQKHSSLLTNDRQSALHVLANTLGVLMKKGWFRFNIGIVRGGVAENVVAGFAEANISVRPRNRAELTEILKTLRVLKGVKVEIINELPPFASSLPKGIGTQEPAAFFSELSFFKKSVLFGAGSILQAHTPGEFIKRKDLARLPGELVKTIEII
jgi:acetylornithine deacetylase/succinyl-diaminopimelate desuccinylase-like protein